MKTIHLLSILILTISLGLKAWAKVDIQKTQVLVLPADQSEPLLTSETSRKILPKSVAEDESGKSVLSKMFDNTVSYLWNNSQFKYTAVGQAADKIDKNLKAEVNLGQSGGTNNSSEKKVEHKLSVKLLAMQALAKIEYKGWVRAGLNYDAKAAKTEAEVLESLSSNKDLVLSHSITSAENKSAVSLRWNW